MAFSFSQPSDLDHLPMAPDGYNPEMGAQRAEMPPDLDPEKTSQTVSEHLADALVWFSDLNTGMADKVREMLHDPEGIFALDMDNVNQFARRIAPQTALLGQLYSDLIKQEIVLKAELESLEQGLKKQRAIVRRELKWGKAEIVGQKPVQEQLSSKANLDDIDAEITLDVRVQTAQTAIQDFKIGRWADMQELKYRVYTTLRAIDRMVNIIPGLQGTARDLGGAGAL